MPEIATKRARYALSGANAATDVDQGVGVAVHHEGGHLRRSKPFGATARRDDGRELTRDATGAKTAIGGVAHACRRSLRVVLARTGVELLEGLAARDDRLAVVSGWSVEECANLDAGLGDVGVARRGHDRGDRRQSPTAGRSSRPWRYPSRGPRPRRGRPAPRRRRGPCRRGDTGSQALDPRARPRRRRRGAA